MRVVKEYERVAAAYKWLEARSKQVGGVTAGVESSDAANVPQELAGAYLVTGTGVRHECTNLARAIVTMHAVRDAQNLWWVDAAGKRTRVAYK